MSSWFTVRSSLVNEEPWEGRVGVKATVVGKVSAGKPNPASP